MADHDPDFERILRLDVHTHIKTRSDFRHAVINGIAEFWNVIPKERGEISPDLVSLTHEVVFGGVYPWAGKIRGPGEGVAADGYPGLDVDKLPGALRDLYKEQIAHSKTNPSYEGNCEMIARFCCEIITMQPFRNGNTTVSTLLSQHKMNRAFGEQKWVRINPEEFDKAIDAYRPFKDPEMMAGLIKDQIKRTRELDLEMGM